MIQSINSSIEFELHNPFTLNLSNNLLNKLDDYSLNRELGIGASATVFLVSRKSDSMEFACKILKKTRIPLLSWTNDSKLGIVPMEVSILSKLNHPNIIDFKELLEDDWNFYIITSTLKDSMVFFKFYNVILGFI